MKAKAAVLFEQPGKWEITDVDLDEPGFGEVLVEMVATGLCHSDDHMAVGDVPLGHLPFVGGHEGAGIVRQVGSGVVGLAEGDHIVASFIPACGKCTWCAAGRQNLCDLGSMILGGTQLDGTYRMHAGGTGLATSGMLGTFANWQVFDQSSCIKVRDDVPLNVACIVACAVPTGFGSAVYAAEVQVGDVVIVMGVGGIGMNAVQGAHYAGASHVIAVDPVAFKREKALELGATEAFETIGAAADFARSITNGQGAAAAIVTVGIVNGAVIGEAFSAIRKAGTVVVTSMGTLEMADVPISLFELTMYQKRIQGALYGIHSPRLQVPMLIDRYLDGKLKLDELITNRYPLEQINDAYADMHSGRNIRGVIDF
jgi:NDMA-dependent alcohol dehydrogenase